MTTITNKEIIGDKAQGAWYFALGVVYERKRNDARVASMSSVGIADKFSAFVRERIGANNELVKLTILQHWEDFAT